MNAVAYINLINMSLRILFDLLRMEDQSQVAEHRMNDEVLPGKKQLSTVSSLQKGPEP